MTSRRQEGAAGCSATERGAGPGSWAWAFLGIPMPLTWAPGEGSLHLRWVPRGRVRRAGGAPSWGPGAWPGSRLSLQWRNTRGSEPSSENSKHVRRVAGVPGASQELIFSRVSGLCLGRVGPRGLQAPSPAWRRATRAPVGVPAWVCVCSAHTCAPRRLCPPRPDCAVDPVASVVLLPVAEGRELGRLPETSDRTRAAAGSVSWGKISHQRLRGKWAKGVGSLCPAGPDSSLPAPLPPERELAPC